MSVFGTLCQGINLNVDPRLSAGQVKALMEQRTGVELGPSRFPTLGILPDGTGGHRLAHRAVVSTPNDGTEFLTDASSGDVVAQYSAAQRQGALGRGVGVFDSGSSVNLDLPNVGYRPSLRGTALTARPTHGERMSETECEQAVVLQALTQWPGARATQVS